MAKFAIVRQDGEVDQAEGASVDDVSNRYGWPGNGTIEPYEAANHPTIRHIFTSPEQQAEALADTTDRDPWRDQ